MTDEIKLQILVHVLPANYFLQNPTSCEELEGYVSLRRHILPVLACPEIASLAIEVHYKQNTVDFSVVTIPEEPLLLPPESVRKHVRSWRAIIYIDLLHCHSFKALACTSTYFPNLKHIKLDIWGTTGILARYLEKVQKHLVAMPLVELVTQGAEIIYTPVEANEWVLDDFDVILEEKLTIGGKRDGVKQICLRKVHERTGLSPGTVVQKWPEGLDLSRYRRQTTIKLWRL